MMIEEDKKDVSFEDDFCHSVRQKLDGHRLPVEDSDWEDMQSLLLLSKAKNRKRHISWILGVAAAIVLLLICLAPFNQKEIEDVWIELSENESICPEILPEEIHKEVIAENSIGKKENTGEEEKLPKIVQTDSGKTKSKEEVNQGLPEVEKNTAPKESSKKESVPAVKEKKSTSFYPEYYDMPLPGRKKNKWQLAAGVFTGGRGGIKGMTDDDYYMDLGPGVTNPGEDNEKPEEEAILARGNHKHIQEMIDQEEYTNISHSLPFSVGFTARKQVANRLSVETGLIYTYLSSEFARSSGSKASYARTRQHYLGIPFNLVWDLVAENNWNLYLSAGGMIEKGIHLDLVKKVWEKENYLEQHTSSGISGVQLSLQFTPGIAYSLSKDWSLYVEPRLSYYFANGQPTSIRTEKSWVIGIGGGLRYTF
ncbi:MAG: PorT family protein [Tannerellaceae bacterium]|nr:PorT family protein [Tannerellaceae bacterium]